MLKMAKRTIKHLVATNSAIDLTHKHSDECRKWLVKREGFVTQIGYASGVYGTTAILLKGGNTGTLYAVTERTPALWLYNM